MTDQGTESTGGMAGDAYYLLVEFDKTRLAVVVENEDRLDHSRWCAAVCGGTSEAE